MWNQSRLVFRVATRHQSVRYPIHVDVANLKLKLSIETVDFLFPDYFIFILRHIKFTLDLSDRKTDIQKKRKKRYSEKIHSLSYK